MPNIGSKNITRDNGIYVIAEIGVNHEGSLDKAFQLIQSAKAAGADGAKFQTYKAEKIASRDSPAYWDLNMEPTRNQYDLFKKHDSFGEKEYLKCAEEAANVGIDFLSTPFDSDAVEFLNPLMPFFKVASADIDNIPMLRQIGKKKKPVIFSTGASTIIEVKRAVEILLGSGASSVVPMHCVLSYPTKESDANLRVINSLRDEFKDCVIGYSDHTLADPSMITLSAAYQLGARVIEKHFTLDKTVRGGDHMHSMDEHDLAVFISNVNIIDANQGRDERLVFDCERLSRKNARRSIVISKDIKKGCVIGHEHLTYKRPCSGISTSDWDEVLGRQATRDLPSDHILQWNDIK